MLFIGLPLVTPDEIVIVQLSRPCDKELKLINVNNLLDLLRRDPDLVHVPEQYIPRIIQVLFANTGCDYISFFSGIGKAFFLKVFLNIQNLLLTDYQDHLVEFFLNLTFRKHQRQAY